MTIEHRRWDDGSQSAVLSVDSKLHLFTLLQICDEYGLSVWVMIENIDFTAYGWLVFDYYISWRYAHFGTT